MMTLAPGSTAWAAGARLRPATRTVPVAATAPVTVRRKGMVLLGCRRRWLATGCGRERAQPRRRLCASCALLPTNGKNLARPRLPFTPDRAPDRAASDWRDAGL